MSNQSISELKGPDLLAHFEDNWQTEMGAAILGKERVVLRGRDLLSEFNNHRWMELMVFAVTGKESKKIARLTEAMWVINASFPDPRLWNNRVAALGGTARTTGSLAVSAAVAVSEATNYGMRPIKGAIDLLHRFRKSLEAGAVLKELIKQEMKQYRMIWGYGRPLVSTDERIPPLLRFAESIGCGDGPFVKLALNIADELDKTRYGYQMNISGMAAAIAADVGVSVDDFYYLSTLCFSAGILPCYIDAANQQQGALFPLSTKRINYTGNPDYRIKQR